LLYLGSLYEEEKEFKEAESVLKQGLSIESNNPQMHFRLGVVYDKMG